MPRNSIDQLNNYRAVVVFRVMGADPVSRRRRTPVRLKPVRQNGSFCADQTVGRYFRLAMEATAAPKPATAPAWTIAVKETIVAEAEGLDAPVDDATLFCIEPTPKGFTTAILTILVDEKKQDWEDPWLNSFSTSRCTIPTRPVKRPLAISSAIEGVCQVSPRSRINQMPMRVPYLELRHVGVRALGLSLAGSPIGAGNRRGSEESEGIGQ